MVDKETSIADFLREFKQIVTQKRGLDLIPRQENNNTIIELGFTKRNVEEIILGLSVTDYCKGPSADRDRLGNVWIFGRKIENKEIYIKLKIACVGKVKIAKCISFHEANYRLNYPLK